MGSTGNNYDFVIVGGNLGIMHQAHMQSPMLIT